MISIEDKNVHSFQNGKLCVGYAEKLWQSLNAIYWFHFLAFAHSAGCLPFYGNFDRNRERTIPNSHLYIYSSVFPEILIAFGSFHTISFCKFIYSIPILGVGNRVVRFIQIYHSHKQLTGAFLERGLVFGIADKFVAGFKEKLCSVDKCEGFFFCEFQLQLNKLCLRL